jgi:haloacetate dehalogenase
VFDAFTLDYIQVDEVTLRVRYGGTGTPVVLVHGHPRTHTTWHAVAPMLAAHHTVVTPDLRGYGRSTLPPDAPGHAQSSKRAMANDIAALMTHLGHEQFAVVGHDRGSLVAFRTAMDHPSRVTHLVIIDGLPVIEHLDRTDAHFASEWWHWWFLGQTHKPAERVINADPDAWYSTPPPDLIGEENHADMWAAFHNPDVVHGMAEDYLGTVGGRPGQPPRHRQRSSPSRGRARARRRGNPAASLDNTARKDHDVNGPQENCNAAEEIVSYTPVNVRATAFRCAFQGS